MNTRKTPGRSGARPATWLLWLVAAGLIAWLLQSPGRPVPRHDDVAAAMLPGPAELAASLGVATNDLQQASPPVDLGRAESAARALGAGSLPATTGRAIQTYRHTTDGYQVTAVALVFADEAAAKSVAELAPRLLSSGLGISVEADSGDRLRWKRASGFSGISARRGNVLVFIGASDPARASRLTTILDGMVSAAGPYP